MPGLASSQLKPSRPPEPVQLLPLPHETSFSRVTLTHLPLLHWLSLLQKHPPGSVHSLIVPLQWPNGQEKPVGVEFGQPPSGHAMPESPPASPTPAAGMQCASEQIWPSVHAVPQAPQFSGSLVVSEHVPLQSVGAFAGQAPTQPYVPESLVAHRAASPPHALRQAPQFAAEEGSVQLLLQIRKPAAQPAASRPPSSPGWGPVSSPPVAASMLSTTSGWFGWTLASHALSWQAPAV
jgi:hypothetical protein